MDTLRTAAQEAGCTVAAFAEEVARQGSTALPGAARVRAAEFRLLHGTAEAEEFIGRFGTGGEGHRVGCGMRYVGADRRHA